jgi:hypothetical protein
MKEHPTCDRRRLIAAALLAVTLAAALLTAAACGDGSEATPVTRTLAPVASPSGSKHGASASPSATGTATTAPSATPSPTPTHFTDKAIKREILARIAQTPGLKGFAITVTVTNRVVYLGGRVRTKAQRELAEQTALHVPGVKKVVSAIDVDDAAGY